MAKKILISEQTVLEAAKQGRKTLPVDSGAIITGAALDRAKQLGIEFIREQKKSGQPSMPAGGATGKPPAGGQVIAIGSDHGGFALKELLKPFIAEMGYKVVDLGTYSDETCDYPDFAYGVARMVSLAQAVRGVMIDAVGIASAMTANKVAGVRAACCTDEFSARSSREHNDANVLTLGGKVLGTELAKAITKIWLETNFGGGRHLKRIAKIEEIEKRNLR